MAVPAFKEFMREEYSIKELKKGVIVEVKFLPKD